jgi:HAD superfamily phosphatase
MNDQAIWIKPQLTLPGPIDTVIFDVDGVLWDTAGSYDRAIEEAVAYILANDFPGIPCPPVTTTELRSFRQAGGLNDDWQLAFTLIAVRLAGLDLSTQERAAAVAASSQGRGRDWADSILPSGVNLDFHRVRMVCEEAYWGAQALPAVLGRTACFLSDAPGTWNHERQLLPDDLLDRLRELGVRHFGIGTGRDRAELSTVLANGSLGHQIAPEAIVTADIATKPDGRVLQLILDGLARHGNSQDHRPEPPAVALFCGDTRDDLQVVLNYRALSRTMDGYGAAAWMGAVAVVSEEQFLFYQSAGSDATIAHIAHLPELVYALTQRQPEPREAIRRF